MDDQQLNKYITDKLSAGRELGQEELRSIANLRQMNARESYRTPSELSAYMNAVVPGVKVVNDPTAGFGEYGYVDEKVPGVININPNLSPPMREVVKLHEQEHTLKNRAVQALPERERIDNDYRFDQLYGDESGKTRREIAYQFIKNRDKIEKFFGAPLTDSYFKMSTYKQQGPRAGALFEEQIASLSALEQVTGKSLTKGLPELFPDDKAAAIYNAITGLRQTRLDSKDLPPYTPQYKSTIDLIKEKLRMRSEGSPETGEVATNQGPGIDEELRKLYRENLAREADTGGFDFWKKEFGPEIDAAERLRFIQEAAPEVQRRMAAGDTTLPSYMKVDPNVRQALQSKDVTTDQYKTLANYFGNQWIAGEAEDPASLTRRDYIERPRSGYDLATFLATRSQQHGATADTQERMANLIAPYTGYNVGVATPEDEGGMRYVFNPITGQQEGVRSTGVDNVYRSYLQPHQGTIGGQGNRFAVGMDYSIDPVTGKAKFVSPYASPYTDRGHRDWQAPVTLASIIAGAHYFPTFVAGQVSLPNIVASNALSAATRAITKADGGEVTKFVKRAARSSKEEETEEDDKVLKFIQNSSKRR